MNNLKGKSNIDDYYMPHIRLENVDDAGIERLREAVIQRSCQDFVNHVRCNIRSMDISSQKFEEGLKSWKRYFNSKDFEFYVGNSINGDKLMDTLMHNTPDKYLTSDEREVHGLHVKELRELYFDKVWDGVLKHDLSSGDILYAVRNNKTGSKIYKIVTPKTKKETVNKMIEKMKEMLNKEEKERERVATKRKKKSV